MRRISTGAILGGVSCAMRGLPNINTAMNADARIIDDLTIIAFSLPAPLP